MIRTKMIIELTYLTGEKFLLNLTQTTVIKQARNCEQTLIYMADAEDNVPIVVRETLENIQELIKY